MTQKTVSFEVAQSLKEAGYPQPQTDVWGYVHRPNNCYFTGRHSYWDEKDENRERRIEWDETNEFHTTDDWADEIEPSFYGSAIAAPTYFEVWLWLWQQKKIYIDINCIQCSEYNTEVSIWHEYGQYDYEGKFIDPVEAMIAGINYLVENNLIK